MVHLRALLLTLVFGLSASLGNAAPDQPRLSVPKYKTSQVLLASKDFPAKPYLSNPCAVWISNHELLFTIKRGTSHGWDQEADCDAFRLNTLTNEVSLQHTL